MKYIIMCGGKYDAFKKQRPLIEINGEALVNRTIRLLKEFGINDVAISTSLENNSFDLLGVQVYKFKNSYHGLDYNKSTGYWCDAFYITDEPICYLMGDVYYSEAALKQIVETETNDILFFGTDAPYAKGYPKKYQEPLAFKVVNQNKFQKACNKFRNLQDLGQGKWPFIRTPIAWELAQIISNQPLNKIIVHTPIFVGIHYFASDIDYESEALELEKIIKEYKID